MRRFAALAALFLPVVPAPAQAPPVTIFLVRHAEKGPEAVDPSLTDAGRRRAAELARVLRDSRVTALFTTEYRRTGETLDPLARARKLTPTVLGAANLSGLVARLQALPPGTRAVVASHSNLIHVIAKRLTGVEWPPLTDADYDRLFVLTLTGPGNGSAVVLRYGDR